MERLLQPKQAPRVFPFVALAAGLTLASGLSNLFVLVWPKFHGRTAHILGYSPLEFRHVSRFLTLIIGFALVVSALHLLRRKRRAFQVVVFLSAASMVLHLLKGRDFEHALLSLLVLLLLLLTRRTYTVGSGLPRWRSEGPGLLLAVAVALTYGIAGFWLLDRREFGLNFNIIDSLHQTFRQLLLVPDPGIVPRTHHALWFIDSLRLMSLTVLGYAAFILYRPVIYHFRIHPHELARAREIVQAQGRDSIDFFKYWPDKSIFLTASQRGFISYKVGASFAIALGDPVGPEEECEDAVRAFLEHCRDNDWGAGFYQVRPDDLAVYERCGLKKLKIGDDAVVDLTTFSLEGRERKGLRHTLSQLERTGLSTRRIEPPIPESDLRRAREVSSAWLGIEGRRERGFTLGHFDDPYVRSTPLVFVEDKEGRSLAFANIIPSYFPSESTIDLMRHRPDAPNGTMDFLFLKLLEMERQRGLARFNLGLAPMSGFQEMEKATPEERAVHQFFQHLNFIFSYRGLKAYKAKFATDWEPRYAVCRNLLELPRLGLALNLVSTIKGAR